VPASGTCGNFFVVEALSCTGQVTYNKGTPGELDINFLILDNGRGFDPMSSESNSATSAAGFCNGLGNMRQRLAELGGDCVVESRIGNGTTIQFVLSLNGSVE